jgi:glycosyltransferase involved in cell wall biosynthesis
VADDLSTAGGVGYVLRKFPVLSETFVLNEILALEERGIPVHIFALAPPRDPRFHEGVSRLKAEISYVPGLQDWRALIRHARRQAQRSPVRFRKELRRVLLTGRPWLWWRFLQAAYIADRARRYRLAHLHAHFANRTANVALIASRLLKIPFSFTAHAFDIFREVDEKVLVRKMKAAAFTVTVSDYNVAHLSSLRGAGGARLELVRNGIDFLRFRPPASPPPAEPFTILAVARLVEKKGLPVLIEACRLLREGAVTFRCGIVGKGAQRGLLEQRIREAGLDEHVHLLGPHTQGQIVARFHAAHVVALPCIVGEDGNRDGLPVSIVEALACGVPVVSTAVTGIPEAVRHEVNGLLVPENDAPALAAALERLAGDRALLARLAAAARPSAARDFDERVTADRLAELFVECGVVVRPDGGDARPRPAPRVVTGGGS